VSERDLLVTINGEGDLSVKTENAWRVEVCSGATLIVVTNVEGGMPLIEVSGTARLIDQNDDTAKLIGGAEYLIYRERT